MVHVKKRQHKLWIIEYKSWLHKDLNHRKHLKQTHIGKEVGAIMKKLIQKTENKSKNIS